MPRIHITGVYLHPFVPEVIKPYIDSFDRLPPIKVCGTQIIDGHHRAYAAFLLGHQTLEIE